MKQHITGFIDIFQFVFLFALKNVVWSKSLYCVYCHLFLKALHFRIKISRNVEMTSDMRYSIFNLLFCDMILMVNFCCLKHGNNLKKNIRK